MKLIHVPSSWVLKRMFHKALGGVDHPIGPRYLSRSSGVLETLTR